MEDARISVLRELLGLDDKLLLASVSMSICFTSDKNNIYLSVPVFPVSFLDFLLRHPSIIASFHGNNLIRRI